jgi:hypothetical protein
MFLFLTKKPVFPTLNKKLARVNFFHVFCIYINNFENVTMVIAAEFFISEERNSSNDTAASHDTATSHNNSTSVPKGETKRYSYHNLEAELTSVKSDRTETM